jgi:hypothetical protein
MRRRLTSSYLQIAVFLLESNLLGLPLLIIYLIQYLKVSRVSLAALQGTNQGEDSLYHVTRLQHYGTVYRKVLPSK